ncbi:hypothetical protein NLI96_g11010 [Meripilus lineatus]|uniref:Uncharacterized protein n=1 Tax=Meripilus lineatus TaxID=2056292 RepID=A0AAD5USN2_9APHY|nr:hypothetical protein NLI96_g11010 [Physisporinus lineatus]
MKLVFHSFEDLTAIPPDVSQLVETSQTPLPPWLDTEKLTSWCKERRVHELNDFCDAHMDDEVYGRLMDPLRDILSLAASIDTLSRVDDRFSPRRTQHLWTFLIQRLGLSSRRSETLSILCEQEFEKPKGFGSETGHASMLMSFSADRALLAAALNPKELSDPFKAPLIYEKGGLEGDARVISQEPEDKGKSPSRIAYDLFFGTDTDSASGPPFIECLDLPLRANILAGSYGWPVAIFPIFSIGDGANIIPLVASIVCQRAVWDIQLPVVAFEISKVGRIGYVHIGWAEQSKSQDVSPSPGIFDLGCPESAMRFGQFILSLDHQLDILERELPTRHPKPMRWRSDELTLMREFLWSGLNDRVRQWLKDVPNNANPLLLSSSENPSDVLTPFGDHVPDIHTTPRSSPVEDVTMSRTQSGGHPSNHPAAEPPQVRAPSYAASSGHPNRAGRVSDSYLAKQAPEAIASLEPTIVSVLFGRRAFCIAKERMNETYAPKELDKMVNVYDEMTECRFPEEGSECFQKLGDPAEVGVKNTPFIDAPSELIAACAKLVKDDYKPPLLEERYERALLAKFRDMIEVHCSAIMAQKSLIRGFKKAETRSLWDRLLSLCYAANEGVPEAESDHVILEATLRMSLNRLANSRSDPKALTKWEGLAEDYADLCKVVAKRAAKRDAPEQLLDLYRQSRREASYLFEDASQIAHSESRSRRFFNTVQEQARKEPSTGKCGALLVAPIRVKMDQKELQVAGKAYHDFCLVHSAQNNPGRCGLPKPPLASPDIPRNPPTRHTSRTQQQGGSGTSMQTPASSDTQVDPTRHHTLSTEGQNNTDDDSLSMSQACRTPPLPTHLPVVPDQDSTPEAGCTPASSNSNGSPSTKADIVIHIPQLVVVYQQPSYGEEAALNQVRISLTSSISFLAHLGIVDHAVFGLVVTGTVGLVVMAWKSKDKDAIYIMERNMKCFDLTNILDVYHFAIFLLRLRTREENTMQMIQAEGSELKNPEGFIQSLYQNGHSRRKHTEWAIPGTE